MTMINILFESSYNDVESCKNRHRDKAETATSALGKDCLKSKAGLVRFCSPVIRHLWWHTPCFCCDLSINHMLSSSSAAIFTVYLMRTVWVLCASMQTIGSQRSRLSRTRGWKASTFPLHETHHLSSKLGHIVAGDLHCLPYSHKVFSKTFCTWHALADEEAWWYWGNCSKWSNHVTQSFCKVFSDCVKDFCGFPLEGTTKQGRQLIKRSFPALSTFI